MSNVCCVADGFNFSMNLLELEYSVLVRRYEAFKMVHFPIERNVNEMAENVTTSRIPLLNH